nr:SLATT domain-containing protein [uncultured Flavobacterium sp.]
MEKSHKDYLEKTFLEELNYKIWSTKGSRFTANKRLLHISKLSNVCNSILSVYLIAIGLLSVYNLYNEKLYNENLIAYSITCLSILLLVFGQIENAKDYTSKAKEFHNCGLELSELYNELRIFKTLDEDQSIFNKKKFASKISNEYQQILEKYPNHEPIDNEYFKSKNAKYHELNRIDVLSIKMEYYIRCSLLYHLLIILPLLAVIILLNK